MFATKVILATDFYKVVRKIYVKTATNRVIYATINSLDKTVNNFSDGCLTTDFFTCSFVFEPIYVAYFKRYLNSRRLKNYEHINRKVVAKTIHKTYTLNDTETPKIIHKHYTKE